MGHMAAECEGKAKRKNGEFDEKGETAPKKPYQFLHIRTLREYLELEMRIPNIPFKIDFERIVDDFIFMCFFVGNDFFYHICLHWRFVRGEKVFCSVECHCKQIITDEHKEKCRSRVKKPHEYSVSPCSGPMQLFAGVGAT